MANMNAVRDRAKSLWMKGMKAVGNTAANIASNTKFKVDEMTLQNRRRELLSDLAGTAYTLWMKGETFPEQMTRLLTDLQQLDDQLNDIRAAKYAYAEEFGSSSVSDQAVPDEKAEPESTSEKQVSEEESPEEASSRDMVSEEKETEKLIPEETGPVPTGPSSAVSSEINGYFDAVSSVGRMAEKVNSSLDQLSDRVKNFSQNSQGDNTGDAAENRPEDPQ